MSVLMRSLALAAAALAATPAAQAQAYPAKPVRLIVPYPAGGATDFFARTVFTKMS
ncbi:MAG: tripartite tricarboxylate transporter substrate binding protein, partial [Betaproteobacteria bacterium]